MLSTKKNVWFSVMLILSIVLFAAACSTQNTETTNSSKPSTSASNSSKSNADKREASEPKETPTFKVVFDFNIDPGGMSLSDNEYIDYIEEKSGVRVEIDSPGSSGYMDKINILMASGEYPDAFMINNGDRNRLLQFATDGLLTDIAPYLDKYPNLKNNMPEDAWLPVTQDGKIFAIPYNRQDGLNHVVYINKEWLDHLNLEIPETIDEYYAVMKAFTEKDPDNNGRHDTFGLISKNDLGYGGRTFKAAFDAEAYQVIDGKVTPPEITENYKSYLTFMHKLTAEGILDPEWATSNTAIMLEKLADHRHGIFSGFWHFKSGLEFPPGVMDPFIAIAPPKRPDGSATSFTYSSTNRHYIAIPQSTKNIEDLLAFFDWALSPEGTKFSYLGIEGVHYTEKDGKIELTDVLPHGIHWAFSLVKHGMLTEEVMDYMRLKYDQEVIDNLMMASETGIVDKIAATLPYLPELSNYNLKSPVEEFTSRAILGNEKIDQAWDSYVERYLSSGGKQSIELWSNWYNDK
jgi:putative aldouronate transport system substrate-binding protein